MKKFLSNLETQQCKTIFLKNCLHMVCSKNWKDLKDKPELKLAVEHEGGNSVTASVCGLRVGLRENKVPPAGQAPGSLPGQELGEDPCGPCGGYT